jgi:integrase
MPRPRTKHTGLPSYCYRDRNGRLYMLHPAGVDASGKLKLKRATYADLDALLAAWRVTWGEAGKLGVLTVADMLDDYLANLGKRVEKGKLAASTAADYTRCVMSLRPIWAKVRIPDADPPAIHLWHEARGEQSVTRANRERTVLFEAFRLGIKRGHAKMNPVEFVQPHPETPRSRYVTDAEFMAVYQKAPPIVQAAMLLAAVTGLRQGDILRLRRSDFSDAGLTVKTRKTGQPLVFAWTEGLRRAVLAAVGAREFVPMVLLSTQDGKPYTSDGFRTLWHKAIVAAIPDKAKRFTFNDLRAKAGSESRDWRLLGHMDQRTFERVYNRLPRQVTPTR